jgi:class 3 adenylate cyclase
VEGELVIGRVDAGLTIEDPLISRRHAVVRPVDRTLEIEDLGSLNGTWVNGERITSARRLAGGDVVTVGSTSIDVDIERDNRTMVAPAAPATGPGMVPAAGARAAVEAPTPRPRLPDRPLSPEPVGDELRPVTALFADIVGSTALGERLAADEVKVVVGECVTRMTRIVEQFGGTVQAYMGDGIAAFFGIPAAHEDDPERASRAGLRIIEAVGDYAAEVDAAWGISNFNARVGINTGETAVGLVGGSDPQSVSLGDTTNVAARLQSAADPGTIAIGEATAKCLVHRFALEPLGEISVKGRSQAVSAWRLVSSQTSAQPLPPTPLVGRAAEIERLQDIVAELTEGRGRLMFFIGDAGIGKTRLLAEARALARERVTWLEGHCVSYGTEETYGPFIQMLRGWIGAQEGEAELSVRTKLRAKLGLLPTSQLPEVMPYLARLLSLRLEPADEARVLGPGAQGLAASLRGAYRAWITSLVRQGPVVIALEDVHWADASTRELAEDLLDLADLAPLLLIATSRVDPSSEGWRLRVRILSDYSHRALDLTLEPLADEAAHELLASLPRSQSLGEEELRHVVAGAEGNPLYLEELLNAFAESSGLRRGHTWAPTLTSARVLSPTLESLLVARIDRLPPGARRLAQVAAVVGRSFPLSVLAHLAESKDLDADLSALLRADVIREHRRYPEPEYAFRHGLLRTASLSTLPPARRRQLYSAAGVAFETLFAATLEDHFEVLAHYFGRSHDFARALSYLERAGERAASLDASARAADLWRAALDAAERLGDEAAQRRLALRLQGLGVAAKGEVLRTETALEG